VTRRLSVTPEAEAELQSAALWYESKRPGLGVEFVVAIDDAFERILGTPEASPVWLPGRPFRRHLVARFPYVIFFCASDGSIDVYAVAHAKRRPGYWLDR
jgi:plasmid stabilization system protein ParE